MSEMLIGEAVESVDAEEEVPAEPTKPSLLARRTQRFRNQHDVLVAMAVELSERSQSIDSLEAAVAIRDLLNRLAGKLVVHLAKEDESLYPRLLESPESSVVAMTKKFIREMGDLASTFETYNKRWVTPANILERQDEFRSETATIVGALGERIDRENNQLYNMADSLPDA